MRLLELLWTHDARLRELAEEVSVNQKHVASKQGEVPLHVYFPIDSVFSVLVWTQDGASTEVGAIGNEGVVGLEVVLGSPMNAETVCQVPGRAMRLRAAILRSVCDENAEVRDALNRYAMALLGQFIQSAACNRLHVIEQRAARWLLMTRDRKLTDEFGLTHEFLAAMLGANRTTVSLTLGAMERSGLIRRARSRIEILDSNGLSEASCECYESIRRLHEGALRGPR